MLDLPVPWKVGKLLEDKISIQSNEEKQRGKVALSTRTEKGRPPCNEGVWSRATHRPLSGEGGGSQGSGLAAFSLYPTANGE